MLGCLLSLILWIIVALIVVFVLEKIISMFISDLDPRILYLIRLLIGLYILILALSCVGVLSTDVRFWPVPRER